MTSRRESFEPTVTTPLLINLDRAPPAPAPAPAANLNGPSNGVRSLANGSLRPNPKSYPSSIASTDPSVDRIAIHGRRYLGVCAIEGQNHRKWEVAVTINDDPERDPIELVDPFTEDEYDKNKNDSTRRGRLQLLDEIRARRYFSELITQLNLLHCCQKADRRISVNEDVTAVDESSDFASLHSLLWEVLEHHDFWPCSDLDGTHVRSVRLSRTLNVRSRSPSPMAADRQDSELAKGRAEYRILLVIARSFKRNYDQRYVDYRPSLIQAPLLDIVRKTRDRKISPKVHIDVVRPGTVEELDEYLNINNKTPYDIVHFDLHGKIGPVNPALRSRAAIRAASKALAPGEQLQIERQSYLRFARPYDPDLLRFRRNDNPIDMLLTDDTSLNDVPVEHIARKLQDCRISKVALSACLSSYAQSRIFLNMCHTFLKHDVAHVSAMSFQTLESTARVYYSAFYESLILRGEAFHVAASEGRKALRANHQQYGYAVLPTDYHQPNRNLNLDTWRTTSEELKPPPVLTVYTARYGTLLCLLVVLCVAYAMAPLSLWLALLSVVVTAAVAVWLATGRWMAKLAPAAEQVRQQQREKSRRSNAPFEIDIEHMVIEDRLKSEANQGALYVWSTDYSKELSECVHDLAQIWVLTGFVDSADIIPAKVFSWAATSAPPWRWLRTRRYRSDRASTIGRRRLLVIKDFDGFYPRDPRPEDRESLRAALLRMVSFIEGYDREDTYLLITGSYDEEWWADGIRYDDERIVDKIVRAVPHNHNITPARKHIPRWSALGIKRRWSAFRNELL